MKNSDGSLLDSGTFYLTEDASASLTMNSLMTSCIYELSSRIAEEARDIVTKSYYLIHNNKLVNRQ